MRSKHLFITLDGVDGVGKTTVAKLLAADGAFQYYKSPSGPFTRFRPEIDAHATPLERYCFYRLAVQFDSARIGRMLEQGSVVCDRYIASTVAYHMAMDDRICDIHCNTGLLKPHFSFLLETSSEKRDERISKRMCQLCDARFERNSSLMDDVAEAFLSFDLIRVDTNDRTAEEVLAFIKRILAQGETA